MGLFVIVMLFTFYVDFKNNLQLLLYHKTGSYLGSVQLCGML